MSQVKYGCLFQMQCVRCQRPLLQMYNRRTVSRNSSHKSSNNSNPVVKYLRSLKWVPIPLGVGFAYIGYQQFGHVRQREKHIMQNAENPEDIVASEWQVKLYTALPLKAMSRIWGRVNDLELPVFMRSPVYKFYIWMFNCNLEEANIRDLKHYRNLGEFFKRRLRYGCRPINKDHSVTSPSDGKVLHFGKVEAGLVEQVKGITYSLQHFLGPITWNDNNDNVVDNATKTSLTEYGSSVKCRTDTDLYHCVIYLAPGDYHGFHSPVHWTLTYRRHFPGELLSVNPGIARWVKGLFNLNERSVYFGKWEQGFCAMAAVGATNVGSINVYCDKELQTNVPGHLPPGIYYDETFSRSDLVGIPMKKGEAFGEFNLGSTIVLIFEAPKSFQFKLVEGQKIKFGQPLGCHK